jgi:hypothetical protein
MRFGFVFAAAVAVSGCTTIEQREASENARFRSFNGMTMAQFMQETAVTPGDAYEANGGRVFVADAGPCRMLITTRRAGPSGSADSWVISSISRRGGCADV